MKRIVASMLALAIAFCFSFSTGCTPKTDKNTVSPTSHEFKEKDKTQEFAVKGSKVKSATSSADKDFSVEVGKDKDKVIVKSLKEPGDAEMKADITITVEGGEPKEFKVTVNMPKKAAATPPEKEKTKTDKTKTDEK